MIPKDKYETSKADKQGQIWKQRKSKQKHMAIAARTNYLTIAWLECLMGVREMVQMVKTLATQGQGPEFEPQYLHKNSQA